MNSLSRRKFLKVSGAAIASAAVVGGSTKIVLKGRDESVRQPIKNLQKIPTYCGVCFWKCGVIASIADGKLWKIDGNPDDPLSNGMICPRGIGGVSAHFNQERLKTPLIRKNKRGKDEWVTASWDEALDYIAEKMQTIKKNYGPESMALFSHGIGGTFFKHTFRAYGSRNITAPSFAQCRGPRDIGFILTFGDQVGTPEITDIKNSKCLVFIGCHLGENMHNTQVQEFSEAMKNGASLIVVDPRFSVAASKAKYYLPIKPGTDLALLLAWMNLIVKEKLYDVDYVEYYGFGFEQFAAEIAQYTPEWAAAETGIEADLIKVTAREMARHKPATLIHPGRRVTWYGDDTQRSRAIALLNALMGSWGRKGGFYIPVRYSIPKYPYPAYPKPARPPVDNPDNRHPFTKGLTITTGIREATITGKPYPIKGWIIYATNLLEALPDQAATIEAMKSLDLLVVVDTVPSEITGWADVILPESTYLERHDELSNAPFRKSFISLRQPVVKEPGDQKPNWWMAKKLAEKLKLEKYYPWNHVEEYLDTRLKNAGLSLKELQKTGVIKEDKEAFYEGEDELEFYTPSEQIEFYSEQLQDEGLDPVPKFVRPEVPPSGYFRLISGRSPVHTFSQTQSFSLLNNFEDENELWVNPTIADQAGLKNGVYIKLKNLDGVVSSQVKVKVTSRIRTDCVYMVHGFGQAARHMKSTLHKGASIAQLTTRYKTDPIMGGTGVNVNFVTFEQV